MSFWKDLSSRMRSRKRSSPELLDIISTFLSAESWDDTKRILEDHPELLEPSSITLITALAIDGDNQVKRICMEHQDFLKRCREVGIEEAFSEKTKSFNTIDSELLSRFEAARSAKDKDQLFALCSEYPELRVVWKHWPFDKGIVVPPPGFKIEVDAIRRLENSAVEDQKDGELLIQTYQRILEKAPQDRYLAFRATINNDLGSTYAKIRWGDRNSNCAQAIHYFQEALHYWTPVKVPFEYAYTQCNLARTYRELQTGDKGENLTKAIECFEEALRVYNLADTPDKYAQVLCELGVTYFELPVGDRGSNLSKSIQFYRKALDFYNSRSAPLQYGSIQYCLGENHRNLPTGDKATNLETAIEYFQQALRYLNPKVTSAIYVLAQNRLGQAYRDLPTGDRATNLANAIEHFRAAQRSITSDTAPEECEIIQSNLDECLHEINQLNRVTVNVKSSATPINRDPEDDVFHNLFHRLWRMPYHETLSLRYHSTFDALFNRVVPPASKMMGTSEKSIRKQITLKLSLEPRISASVQTNQSVITICFGMMQFIARLLYLFFCQVDIETRRVPRSSLSRKELDKLTLILLNEFWEAGGNITDSMNGIFDTIENSVDDDTEYIPIIEDIYRNVGSFVVAHELGHIIVEQKRQAGEEVPGYDLSSFFTNGLQERGFVDEFARLSGIDPDQISQNWKEELCADAIALDLCLSQDPVDSYLARLLAKKGEENLPQQMYKTITSGYAVHVSVDLFFMLLHMLDLYYARTQKRWIPMEWHPPSLVRLVFVRSVFQPPKTQILHPTDGSEPRVMINLSRAMLGDDLPLSLSPLFSSSLALTRFTSQYRFDSIVQNLIDYLGYYLNDKIEETGVGSDVKMAEIISAFSSDPVFQIDNTLLISNAFGEIIERIFQRSIA